RGQGTPSRSGAPACLPATGRRGNGARRDAISADRAASRGTPRRSSSFFPVAIAAKKVPERINSTSSGIRDRGKGRQTTALASTTLGHKGPREEERAQPPAHRGKDVFQYWNANYFSVLALRQGGPGLSLGRMRPLRKPTTNQRKAIAGRRGGQEWLEGRAAGS